MTLAFDTLLAYRDDCMSYYSRPEDMVEDMRADSYLTGYARDRLESFAKKAFNRAVRKADRAYIELILSEEDHEHGLEISRIAESIGLDMQGVHHPMQPACFGRMYP